MIEFTQHAIKQMDERGISRELVMEALTNPKEKVEADDYIILHYLYSEQGKKYLLRVFVNEKTNPNKIITVYRTSKIDKYYES